MAAGPGRLHDGADLWLTTKLADLRAEDGGIDGNKVKAAVDQALADRPHWRNPERAASFGGGPRRDQPTTEPSFGEALKGVRVERR